MTGHKNDPWDKPWVTIAMIVGILAVVVIALVFFMGSGDTSDQSLPVKTTPTSSGAGTQATLSGSSASPPMTIKVPTTASIPATGIFVKVSYLGGFSGMYGVNGVMQNVRNSGDRLYEITNTTGNISATFKKEDGSTTHEIRVELWKNGKSLASAKNSTPFGTASINYAL
jgi:flagellar basal body-associated protein FliL